MSSQMLWAVMNQPWKQEKGQKLLCLHLVLGGPTAILLKTKQTMERYILIISHASFTKGVTNSRLKWPMAPVKAGDEQRTPVASPGRAGLITGSHVAGVDKGGCV